MGYDPSGNIIIYMNPMNIRFSQDSIKVEFGDYSQTGRTVFDTIRELQEGTATADTIPAIKVLTSDFIIEHYAELDLEWYMVKYLRRGLTFTLDNRRLYAFQQANMQQIRVEYATREEIIAAKGKFSTLSKDFARKKYKFGTYIRVRD